MCQLQSTSYHLCTLAPGIGLALANCTYMKIVKFSQFLTISNLRWLAFVAVVSVVGCSGSSSPSTSVNPPPTGDFELQATQQDWVIVEGDDAGLHIPVSLIRENGHSAPVTLSFSGVTTADEAFLSSSFTHITLNVGADESEAVLTLAIADLPLLAQQREFLVTASDGQNKDDMPLTITVEPVNAPDVYLLVGQSNMVGFSGDGTRQAGLGGEDEPHPRIKQLNVSKNDRQTLFLTAEDFTSTMLNVVMPNITGAEDPLHVPRDPSNTSGKNLEYIGLGLSFAKKAIDHTTRDIILVPAAWSGSAFCTNPTGPNGQWNSQASDNPNLGNTWLFDRAITRANLALQSTGGILRGILWHQGESDINDRCAPLYSENLERLVYKFRQNIQADRRGSELRQPDSNIPFIVGTMSKGIDDRGDYSTFPPSKQVVDLVHRNLPNQVPSVGLSVHDDLIPANGYPCGNSFCVHFGPDALREMGRRYYDALLSAAAS